MALFYTRIETPAQVEYRFHFLPVFYVAFGVATLLSLSSRGGRTNGAFGTIGLLFLAWIAGTFKPMAEIQRAMSHGSVEATGNKFSFSNPLRIILHKHEALGGVPGIVPSQAGVGL